MALLPKEQAAIDDARRRGLSQKKIDTFLSENTGDYSRLASQKPDDPNEGARARAAAGQSAPMAALQAAAPASSPAAGASPSPIATPEVPGSPTQESAAAMAALPPPPDPAGMGLQGTAIGALRALGQRSYPQTSTVLAGLRRIY